MGSETAASIILFLASDVIVYLLVIRFGVTLPKARSQRELSAAQGE